jgi:hypothetical protein
MATRAFEHPRSTVARLVILDRRPFRSRHGLGLGDRDIQNNLRTSIRTAQHLDAEARAGMSRPMRFFTSLALSTAAAAATWRSIGEGAAGQRVKQPLTSARELRLAFIISELQSLFIAMAALVPTADVSRDQRRRNVG